MKPIEVQAHGRRPLRLSRTQRWLLIAVALITGMAGCAGPQPRQTTAPSGGVVVVTTTTVFADLVRNVGGSRVDVRSIVPAGVGPEDYEPKPDDAKLLSQAKLVVSNGVGLDDFLEDLLESGTGGDTPRLVLGEGIPAVTQDGEANPHFWLDPTLVTQHYVPRIVAGLVAADPPGKATFDANAARYVGDIEALDAELLALVGELPQASRRLVTFHDAFPYFAQHFGFELVGVILENVGQEPTASELAALVDAVKGAGVRAVFSEAQFSPRLSETLATEAGITKVVTTLYTDSLGPAPADTYAGMLRWDVEQIVEALR